MLGDDSPQVLVEPKDDPHQDHTYHHHEFHSVPNVIESSSKKPNNHNT